VGRGAEADHARLEAILESSSSVIVVARHPLSPDRPQRCGAPDPRAHGRGHRALSRRHHRSPQDRRHAGAARGAPEHPARRLRDVRHVSARPRRDRADHRLHARPDPGDGRGGRRHLGDRARRHGGAARRGAAAQPGRRRRVGARVARPPRGRIAHDFNNLMAVITGYAGVLAREVQRETSVHAVEEVQRAARRAAELTSQLLAFSRQRPAAPTTVDVAETVVGVRAMLERLLGADMELIVRVEGDVVPVLADRGQLEQVVVNLHQRARRDARRWDAAHHGRDRAARRVPCVHHRRRHRNGDRARAPGEHLRAVLHDEGDG
jgi:hypothetical protein